MAPDTSLDTAALRKAAEAIGSLLDSYRPGFEALRTHSGDLGTAPSAQWLEGVVNDRGDAIVGHYTRLDSVFGEMRTTLRSVAEDLDGTDKGNAAAIGELASLRKDVDADLGKLGQDS